MKNTAVIDVWMQHPTLRFINLSIFESLRRGTGMETLKEEIPIDFTAAAMDQGGVDEETRNLFLHGNARRVFGL
jgi:hypothetical protein